MCCVVGRSKKEGRGKRKEKKRQYEDRKDNCSVSDDAIQRMCNGGRRGMDGEGRGERILFFSGKGKQASVKSTVAQCNSGCRCAEGLR